MCKYVIFTQKYANLTKDAFVGLPKFEIIRRAIRRFLILGQLTEHANLCRCYEEAFL